MMLDCPRDGTALARRRLGDVQVDFCRACHGCAVAIGDAERLALRLKAAPGWPSTDRPPSLRHEGSSEKGMKCSCGEPSPTWLLRRKDVRIDYCPTCRHLWLDRGEARRLDEFIRGLGGVRELNVGEVRQGARNLTARVESRAADSYAPFEALALLLEILSAGLHP